MSAIIDFSTIKDTDYMVIFTDKCPDKSWVGRKLPIIDKTYHLRFDDMIDFKEGRIVYSNENADPSLPTLNDLMRKGIITVWHPFKEYCLRFCDDYTTDGSITRSEDGRQTIGCVPYSKFDRKRHKTYVGVITKGGVLDVGKVVKWFKDNCGITVSPEAIEHNFNAWVRDLKSGYRDEANGLHVFTPCGCNDLSFSCSELHPTAEDYQKTYTC